MYTFLSLPALCLCRFGFHVEPHHAIVIADWRFERFIYVKVDLVGNKHNVCHCNLFRSKPVVRVKSKLSFPHTANKQINLDEKGCTLRDRTAVTCTQLAICMEYDGVGADDVVGKGETGFCWESFLKTVDLVSVHNLVGMQACY